MSETAIYRRDRHGVILRYEVDRPLPSSVKSQASDRARIALIRAERELAILEIIFDHLELSDLARTRLASAVDAVYRALEVKRPALGLAKSADPA